MTARAFLGAGDLYIALYVSGVPGPYRGPFECDKFEIKPNVELKEKVSKGKTTYGQVIESVALPQPSDLTIALGEVNKEGLALALLGTTEAYTQASGTITDEVIVADLDNWVPLSKAKFTGTITVKHTSDTPVYVEGTDYIVNRALGWVKALTGGAITDGQSVEVSGAYEAIAGSTIRGATQTQVRARFKLDGKNFADDTLCTVTVYEAVIAADSAFDFLADDFNSIELPGRMKTPAGFLEPFIVQLHAAST